MNSFLGLTCKRGLAYVLPGCLTDDHYRAIADPTRRAILDELVERDEQSLLTSFAVGDTAAEYERLGSLGVRFTQPPVDCGTAITAVFDDTCENLIQITQENLGS